MKPLLFFINLIFYTEVFIKFKGSLHILFIVAGAGDVWRVTASYKLAFASPTGYFELDRHVHKLAYIIVMDHNMAGASSLALCFNYFVGLW